MCKGKEEDGGKGTMKERINDVVKERVEEARREEEE